MLINSSWISPLTHTQVSLHSVTNQPTNQHVFGTWEGTGALGEDQYGLRENKRTPHKQHQSSGLDAGLWNCEVAVLSSAPLSHQSTSPIFFWSVDCLFISSLAKRTNRGSICCVLSEFISLSVECASHWFTILKAIDFLQTQKIHISVLPFTFKSLTL